MLNGTLGDDGKVVMHMPQDETYKLSAGGIIGYLVISILILICGAGLLVENTNLFSYTDLASMRQLNMSADQQLMSSKNWLGKALLCFSP